MARQEKLNPIVEHDVKHAQRFDYEIAVGYATRLQSEEPKGTSRHFRVVDVARIGLRWVIRYEDSHGALLAFIGGFD